MNKVFAFTSSQKGEKSNSYIFTKMLLETLSNRYPKEIQYEIMHPQNIKLIPCQSCNRCFYKGFCKLDDNDDIKIIKEKMLNSDFIILASPVFLHHVSSDMKLVIDRISYWAHLFRLAGKKSATVSVSSSNGNHYVDMYLTKVLETLGTQVVNNFAITIDDPPLLNNQAFLEKELPKYADSIYTRLQDNQIVTSKNQEKYYLGMYNQLKKASSLIKDKSAEYKYWEDNGMLQYNNLRSYILHLRKS